MEVLKGLNHDRIPVFGAYQKINGRWLLHIVQEMVDGDDLNAWLKDHTPTLAEDSSCLPVLGILVYLHGHQPPVIHRDQTFELDAPIGRQCGVDRFGQAHDIHRTMGQTMVTGTLGYQSLSKLSKRRHQIRCLFGGCGRRNSTGLSPHDARRSSPALGEKMSEFFTIQEC